MNIFKKLLTNKGDFNAFHNSVATFLCIPFGSPRREIKETFKSYDVTEQGNSVQVRRNDPEMNYEVHYIYSMSSNLLMKISIRIWSPNSNLTERHTELLNSIAQRPYLNYGDGGPLCRNMRYFFFESVNVSVSFDDNANSVDDDNYYIDLSVETHGDVTSASYAEYPRPVKYVYVR